MKPNCFISSASESLPIAKALAASLSRKNCEPALWSEDIHKPSEYNLESLLNQARSGDFAVFIFMPDDQAIIRNNTSNIVRDNVLFELGVFIGVMGRERCFIVQGTAKEMRLPSDLHGVTTINYDPQTSPEDQASQFDAIADKILNYTRHTHELFTKTLTVNDLKVLKSCHYPSMPSNQSYKTFGSMPGSWDDKLCMRFLRLMQLGLIETVGSTEIESSRKGKLIAETIQTPG